MPTSTVTSPRAVEKSTWGSRVRAEGALLHLGKGEPWD
jgi:hypothetical protein